MRGPPKGPRLEQRAIALLLLGRHLVIGNLGIAAEGRRLGHGRSPQRSATRQRIDLRAARRRRLRRPSLAPVVTAPDLAAIGGARHPVRLMFVKRNLEHRVRHRRAEIDLRPAVAAVAAAEQYAEIADEAGAGGEPEVPRIAGHLANVAAVDLPL